MYFLLVSNKQVWLRNLFRLVSQRGWILSIWVYWSNNNNDRLSNCLRENGDPSRSYWYRWAVWNRSVKHLWEQRAYSSQSHWWHGWKSQVCTYCLREFTLLYAVSTLYVVVFPQRVTYPLNWRELGWKVASL